MQRIVINGKFMSQKVTGVQRYAREILLELDKILTDNIKVELLVNQEAKDIPEYKNIKTVRYGKLKGNLWEQISLPIYVYKNKSICVNLCNMAPILTPHIVTIHDVSFKVNPHFYSFGFRIWYDFVFRLIINRIKIVLTDSEFSKNEIFRVYNRRNNVFVVNAGWQHFNRIFFNETSLCKYGLNKDRYFFSVSSMAPNKNFKWIAEAARNNPDYIFAVSGTVNKNVFGRIITFDVPNNLKFLGYVSDEEVKTLMRDCRAFLFPTFYEGFGLPPLEALSAGARVIVSDTSCMREIFGDSVIYINPNNAEVNLNELIHDHIDKRVDLLGKYSWKQSSERILSILNTSYESEKEIC